ncbi:MAG: response regulator transcription factor [Clostridiales bacterium]|nr:response regulator transcription factor [Clostridiales bacterium]
MERQILVIEDEKTISDILIFNLQREGYKTLEAADGNHGLKLAMTESPDLILLDVMLPGIDGFEICRRVREQSEVPIIMLTAREEETDKVLGLDLGADDYITKPFSMRELMARVKANMRRGVSDSLINSNSTLVTFGDVSINPEKHEVKVMSKSVDLTTREYELLTFLVTWPDKVFSREELMEKVWNYGYYGDLRTVDVAVRRLREKIEQTPGDPKHIMTKRGLGYYFTKNN